MPSEPPEAQEEQETATNTTELSPPEAMPSKLAAIRRRSRTVLVYLTGQGLVLILNFSIGFLLLRWLSVDNYAQFSVAFGFQSTLGLLADLGFGGTIVALIGSRGDDPDVVGDYIRSARRFRNIILAILTPLAAIFYVGIAREHHWSAVTSTLLFLSVVSAIYFSGMMSYYAAPLLIHGKISRYFRIQAIAAVARIGTSAIFLFTGLLNAWTCSWINTFAFVIAAVLNMRASRIYARVPEKAKPEITQQMVRYVTPNIPTLIFYSLQGQISVFLISFFGHTQNIAEIGALSRLGQIFLILSGFNATVIEPFMARLPEKKVGRNFLSVLGVASTLCVALCLVAFVKPSILLLLLGPKYKLLTKETSWLILGNCFAYLVGVTWTMGAARRWIYWTTSWLTIGSIVLAQAVFLALVRVDTTLHVVYFGVATSAAHLTAVLINSAYGYVRGPSVKTT